MSNAPKFNVYALTNTEDACLFERPDGQLVPHTLSLVNQLTPNICYRIVADNGYSATADYESRKGPLIGHLVQDEGFVALPVNTTRYPVYDDLDDEDGVLIMQRDGTFGGYYPDLLDEVNFKCPDESMYMSVSEVRLGKILGWVTVDGYKAVTNDE